MRTALLLLVTGCGRLAFDQAIDGGGSDGDADGDIDAALDAAPLGLFGAPMPILELGNQDLYVAKR